MSVTLTEGITEEVTEGYPVSYDSDVIAGIAPRMHLCNGAYHKPAIPTERMAGFLLHSLPFS